MLGFYSSVKADIRPSKFLVFNIGIVQVNPGEPLLLAQDSRLMIYIGVIGGSGFWDLFSFFALTELYILEAL